MKNKRYQPKSFYIECVQTYVNTSLTNTTSFNDYGLDCPLEYEKLILTLASMLYPKEMKKSSFALYSQFGGDLKMRTNYVQQFHDALYNFSMEKVSEALENRYIGILLKMFITRINEREKVQEIMSVFEASYSKAL